MKKMFVLATALFSTLTFANVDTVRSHLLKNAPDVKIENLKPTEMKGIYSGTLNGQVVYVNEDAQHILAGSMLRLKDQKNLTKDLVIQQNTIDWKQLPLKDAIKIVKGNGQRQLAIFTDPNCPYCKKLEEELKQLNNVTLYIFVTAFKSQSVAPSKQIFCESNPAQAWNNLITKGIAPQGEKSCANPIQRNLELAQKLKVTGTPTIIFSNGFKVSGAYPANEIEKIFKEFGL